MRLEVTVGEQSGWTVVTVNGEVDFQTAEQMSVALSEASTTAPWLVIDCGALTFCDSSFLGWLIRAYRRAQADGATLIVAAAPPRLERLLDRTGLDQVLSVYPSVAEAVGSR